MSKWTPWHAHDPESQDKMAATYLENMRILDGADIGYEDKGTLKEIRAPGLTAVLKPHYGTWVMEVNGEKKSGRGFREFIQTYRRYQ